MFFFIKNILKDIFLRFLKIVFVIFFEGCEFIVCIKSAEWKVFFCEYIRLLGISNLKNKIVVLYKVFSER